jgi:hypothetical protein
MSLKVSSKGLVVDFQPNPSVIQIKLCPSFIRKSYNDLYSPAVALSFEPPPP